MEMLLKLERCWGLVNEGSVIALQVKEIIKKIKPTNEIENNVVSLDIEKKEPIIFDKNVKPETSEEPLALKDQALVLTNELTEITI